MLNQAIQSTVGLLLLMSVGYYLNGTPWFSSNGTSIFSKYALSVALPCYMVYNIYTTIHTKELLFELLRSLPIPLIGIFSTVLFGIILAKALRIDKKRFGVFVNICGLSNTVIIGFPVVTSLLGNQAAPLGMIYYMANTLSFWTIGVYLLRCQEGERSPFFSIENLKKIFSPPLVGLCIGIFLLLFKIELPTFLFIPLEYLARSATPIALIFIGCVIRSCNIKTIKIDRDFILLLIARFLFSPLIMYCACLLLPAASPMRPIFLILSTMPAMTQLGIMAQELKSDYEFASLMIAVSTTVSMIFLPIYTVIMSWLNIL